MLAARGTSSGGWIAAGGDLDLADDSDFTEDGRPSALLVMRNLSGELHSLLLLLVELAMNCGGMRPGGSVPAPEVAAAIAAAICDGDLNIELMALMGSTRGLL